MYKKQSISLIRFLTMDEIYRFHYMAAFFNEQNYSSLNK